jgi:Ca-activated chloride channel family protein
MRFGNPHFLKMLMMVPVIILFYVWAFKRKQALIERFVSPQLKAALLTGVSFGKQRAKATLLVLTLLFAILALLRPQWGFHWEEMTRRGVDIIIAVDVSKSMLAQDVSPTRITRAKRKIADLLSLIQGDRVGLIAFAGEAFVQCPLTLDHGAAAIFLDSIDPDLIPTPGSAIGETITTAIRAFEKSKKNARVLILITDGEDTIGDPMQAATEASEAGIQIYTIGIGSTAGAPIPAAGGGFKKDKNGEMVLTRLDEAMLKKIALETGGGYVRSITGDADLTQIYEAIRMKTEGKELKSRKKRFVERYQWPLFVALFFLLLEGFLSERASHARSSPLPFKGRLGGDGLKRVAGSLGFLLVFAGLLFCSPAWAGSIGRGKEAYTKEDYKGALKEFQEAQVDSPQRFDLIYNTGNSYYKTNQYKEADTLFSSVSESQNRNLKKKAFYNRGNTAYRQGKLMEAVDDYQKALKIDPKDKDAKYNLDFVKREIERRLAKKTKSPSSSEGEKKGSEEKGSKGDKGDQDKKGKGQKANAGNERNEKKEGKRNKALDNQDKPMTKEEAEQWLALAKEDRSMLNEQKKQKAQRHPVEKDW